MAEVNIMEDLEEHNNDYEKVEADDESEYGDCHPKIKITMALMLIMAIKGRADHLVHLGPDMDHRPDRRDDELCSLESTRVHLRRSHCEQEACCRSLSLSLPSLSLSSSLSVHHNHNGHH